MRLKIIKICSMVMVMVMAMAMAMAMVVHFVMTFGYNQERRQRRLFAVLKRQKYLIANNCKNW